MLQRSMRNIFLFSIVVLFAASCQQYDYSADEPLLPEDKSAIYISADNNILYALDPQTGSRIWERQLDFSLQYEPLVLDGLLFLSSPVGVLKIDGNNGKIVDTTFDIRFPEIDTNPHYVQGPLSGLGEYIYAGTSDDYFAAFNYKTREVLWQTKRPNPSSTALFAGSLVIYAAENELFALNAADGNQVAWTFTGAADLNNPVLAQPYVYVIDKTGVLTALEIETGNTLWVHNTGASVESSPISYGKFLIYGADDNRLHCIDPDIAGLNKQAWEYLTGERVQGSAIGYDNTVYFGGVDHHFYALNTISGQSGNLEWRYRTGGLIKSSPIAYNGMIYIASYDKHIYGFDTTGTMRWKFNLNGLVNSSPVLYDATTNKATYPAPSGMSTPQ